MGLLDFFGGGSGPDKALKLKPKVTQKYGEPSTRQKALQQLGEMKYPEAVTVLLSRFTITVDPQLHARADAVRTRDALGERGSAGNLRHDARGRQSG